MQAGHFGNSEGGLRISTVFKFLLRIAHENGDDCGMAVAVGGGLLAYHGRNTSASAPMRGARLFCKPAPHM